MAILKMFQESVFTNDDYIFGLFLNKKYFSIFLPND